METERLARAAIGGVFIAAGSEIFPRSPIGGIAVAGIGIILVLSEKKWIFMAGHLKFLDTALTSLRKSKFLTFGLAVIALVIILGAAGAGDSFKYTLIVVVVSIVCKYQLKYDSKNRKKEK